MTGLSIVVRGGSDVNIDPIFTHKGWFWFVPVFMSDPESNSPMVVETRREWMEPLFTLAECFERARIWLTVAIDPDYEPAFMLKVTGPIQRTYERA